MKVNHTAANVLNDALHYLEKLEPTKYQEKIDILFNSSIGQHTRHFVEFYQCLLSQVLNEGQVIDYARRERNHLIESDPSFAAQCVRDIQSQLMEIDDATVYELECSEHLPGDHTLCVPTNVQRELMYNIEHTIHHLAIIKIGLKSVAPELAMPDHFGVAPSTIQYKNDQSACAQ